MIDTSLKAAALLKQHEIDAKVLNVHTIKPLDIQALVESAKATGAIITVEDHSIYGGLGGAVAEVLSQEYPVPIKILGVPDVYGGSSRNADSLLKEYGLTPDQLAATAEKIIEKRK